MGKSRVVVEGDGVIVHFKGKFEDGSEFSSKSDGGPLEFNVGKRMVLEGLDKAVVGMAAGERKKVVMPPVEAFGEWDEELVKQVSQAKLNLDETPKVGMTLQVYDGSIEGKEEEKIINAVIKKIDGDVLTIDYNHPLAGKSVTLHLEMVEIL